MSVVPLPSHARWVADLRGEGRAARVSAHAEAGFLVLSVWRDGACVGTVRLQPAEAAELMAGLAEGLGRLAADGPTAAVRSTAPDEPPAADGPPAAEVPPA